MICTFCPIIPPPSRWRQQPLRWLPHYWCVSAGLNLRETPHVLLIRCSHLAALLPLSPHHQFHVSNFETCYLRSTKISQRQQSPISVSLTPVTIKGRHCSNIFLPNPRILIALHARDLGPTESSDPHKSVREEPFSFHLALKIYMVSNFKNPRTDWYGSQTEGEFNEFSNMS